MLDNDELQRWEELGLIARSSFYEAKLAKALERMRKHIEVGEAGWDERRKAEVQDATN